MSTENCEHVFGESRCLVSDWTIMDFVYMLPKLEAKISATIFSDSTSDSWTHATGYAHTYFDCSGLDLLKLATFPSDNEIYRCSEVVYKEAVMLFASCDIFPRQFLGNNMNNSIRLPSISSWAVPMDELFNDKDDQDIEEDLESVKLQYLIRQAESDSHLSMGDQDKILNLYFAAISVSMDNRM